MSYGGDQVDMFRQAASYAPVKYESILNLKTAKALDLAVPPGLLVGRQKVTE